MLKHWRKKLLKSSLAIHLLCALIAGYIRCVYHTSRIRMDMPEETKPYAVGEKPALFVFWHGRLLMMPPVIPKQRPMHVMISHHADGELIARTIDRFGMHTVRGSSSKGGASAAAEAVNLLKQGDNLGITPDGPRGPARQVQPGAARIAAMAGVPIIPVSYNANRGKTMRSWDAFFIPYPFNSIRFNVGAPLFVSKEETESANMLLQERLNAPVQSGQRW